MLIDDMYICSRALPVQTSCEGWGCSKAIWLKIIEIEMEKAIRSCSSHTHPPEQYRFPMVRFWCFPEGVTAGQRSLCIQQPASLPPWKIRKPSESGDEYVAKCLEFYYSMWFDVGWSKAEEMCSSPTMDHPGFYIRKFSELFKMTCYLCMFSQCYKSSELLWSHSVVRRKIRRFVLSGGPYLERMHYSNIL